jgi:hypothetical protein
MFCNNFNVKFTGNISERKDKLILDIFHNILSLITDKRQIL